MSIDIEIGTSLSNEDAAHFAAKTEAITSAMQRVREQHAAYSWVRTDEIRCRGCSASLDVPRLASTKASADKAFQAHQSAQLDALLAAEGRPGAGS
ncbi:hypothetical protein Asphe3_00800 [Pseudarthrobacter phenanthrenivorans Sphe3]|jgi:hypothetical protein|nr:hypothetical protein [Pseudarthrobacter phenanthrenivorans]ADX71299.1 hypothetical protein Asphe3_00800 [Pseudarthrobacter phenanthrenivorans Sphe3]